MMGESKKRNPSRDAQLFLQFCFVKKKVTDALCMSCGRIAPETTFPKLTAITITPIEGGNKLRLGECGCRANISRK
jgi:hypothetical protein